MRMGLAVRSSSRVLMLSLSEETCIILQILHRKIYTHHATCRIVLQETLLMGLQEEPLSAALRKEKQSPLGIVQQPLSGASLLCQLEGYKGERVYWQVDVGYPFLDATLKKPKVPQRCE